MIDNLFYLPAALVKLLLCTLWWELQEGERKDRTGETLVFLVFCKVMPRDILGCCKNR